jgi:hypothetical protein
MSRPPARGSTRVTGVPVDNQTHVFFKKSKQPATHPLEGQHALSYKAPVFDAEGNLDQPAELRLDGGPPLNIEWPSGRLYAHDPGSPYIAANHTSEDYKFVSFGPGPEPDSLGVLADSRGLQRFEVGGEKDDYERELSVRSMQAARRTARLVLDVFSGWAPQALLDAVPLVEEDEHIVASSHLLSVARRTS